MAANFTDDSYCQCEPNDSYCPPSPVLVRPVDVFEDSLLHDMLGHIHDSTCAAWNAWEAAVKFEDDEKARKYMRYIVILQQNKEKLMKIK